MTARHWDDRRGAVAAAVHYFETDDDQERLLDYLDEPTSVTLHPWPVVRSPIGVLLRSDALVTQQVMVVHNALGPPVVIRPGDRAMEEATKAGVFNRINWDRLRRDSGERLVDSNLSRPVLAAREGLGDALVHQQHRVTSRRYGGRVHRVREVGEASHGLGRRKGTRVWGLERHEVRPDLDIDLNFVNNVYALPKTLIVLQDGAVGRG